MNYFKLMESLNNEKRKSDDLDDLDLDLDQEADESL